MQEVNLFQADGNVVHFLNPKGEPPVLDSICSGKSIKA